jgi:N-acetyl-alpha-D-muramate 1-phosphate uridylyltransferase
MFPIVIICGGLGTRLQLSFPDLPKSLIMINSMPFVHHQLLLLKSKGFEKIYFCLGHLGTVIEEVVGNGKANGLNIKYSYDGEQLLGTGGCIKNALPIIEEDNFFTIYGDSYLDINYYLIQHEFIKNNKLALMTVYKNNNEFDKSNVEYNNGKILDYNKATTNKMQHIDYGVSIFNRKAFDKFTGKFDLQDVFRSMLQKNQLLSYVAKNRFYEIGSLNGIKELSEYLKNKEKI